MASQSSRAHHDAVQPRATQVETSIKVLRLSSQPAFTSIDRLCLVDSAACTAAAANSSGWVPLALLYICLLYMSPTVAVYLCSSSIMADETSIFRSSAVPNSNLLQVEQHQIPVLLYYLPTFLYVRYDLASTIDMFMEKTNEQV